MQYVFQNDAIFRIHISQGSVATCLKRGGIFKHEFVANLLPSRLVKTFENRIIVSEVMAKSLWCLVFLTHGVVHFSYLFVSLAYLSTYRQLSHAVLSCIVSCECEHYVRISEQDV